MTCLHVLCIVAPFLDRFVALSLPNIDSAATVEAFVTYFLTQARKRYTCCVCLDTKPHVLLLTGQPRPCGLGCSYKWGGMFAVVTITVAEISFYVTVAIVLF